jgi:hypothetical protein
MDLNVKYSLFLSDFNKTTILSKEFRKIDIVFNENPSCGSLVFLADGQTGRQTGRQTSGEAAITNVVIGYREIIGLLKFFDLFLRDGNILQCYWNFISVPFNSMDHNRWHSQQMITPVSVLVDSYLTKYS